MKPMRKEDELYLRCLEEAERLIDRGYIGHIGHITVDELTEQLLKRMKASGKYQELLDRD
jgi:hypothetical protein